MIFTKSDNGLLTSPTDKGLYQIYENKLHNNKSLYHLTFVRLVRGDEVLRPVGESTNMLKLVRAAVMDYASA